MMLGPKKPPLDPPNRLTFDGAVGHGLSSFRRSRHHRADSKRPLPATADTAQGRMATSNAPVGGALSV
jgi:hypothetical protein